MVLSKLGVTQAIIPRTSMAIPFVPLATVGQWLVIFGLAPSAEEIFFRCILLSLFLTVFKWKFIFSNLVQGILFAAYHIASYAGEISVSAISSVSGSFVAAFAFGLLAGYLTKRFGLMSAIIAHMVINGILLFSGFIIIT